MIKSKKLELLCARLSRHPPNWEAILGRFMSHPLFNRKDSLYLREYLNHFSEIHLDVSLEEVAKQIPGRVNFDPIKDGSVCGEYTFHYSPAGRLFVHSNGEQRAEYDKLVLLEELPVVFEIKLSRRFVCGNNKRNAFGVAKHRGRRSSIRESLEPMVYDAKLRPVREFFGRDVGYVIVIPNKMYEVRIHVAKDARDSRYNQFKESGGMVVPFYTDRESFKEEACEKIEECGLKVKPAPITA